MRNTNKVTIVLIAWHLLMLIGLLLYSFTQIDLNLTLSSNAIYQTIQSRLLYFGYFMRPQSTTVYTVLVVGLSLSQIGFLWLANRNLIQTNTVWKMCLISAAILVFSYPAFSHDIFNYIFDARILVTHHTNPWQFTALDFPNDEWTRFMRWTHRTYPYGPLWITLTVPVYILGIGKFSLTLLLFKALGAASYLGSTLGIKRILERLFPKYTNQGLVLFAMNPLVIIETLVSAHIDAVMTTALIFSIYLLLVKKHWAISFLSLLLSIGCKYITIVLLPVWFIWRRMKKEDMNFINMVLLFTAIGVAVEVYFRELLPWYFIPLISLLALAPRFKRLNYPAIILSVGLLMRYTPFLYIGEYNKWVYSTRNLLSGISLLMAVCLVIWLKKKESFSPSSF